MTEASTAGKAGKKIEIQFDDLRSFDDEVPEGSDWPGVEDRSGSEELDDTPLDEGEELNVRPAKPVKEGGELAEDGEYNPAKMTKEMSRRILRERRRFDRILNERLAEKEAEFREELERVRGSSAEPEVELDNSDLEAQIESALEVGNSKLAASLTRQMTERTAKALVERQRKQAAEPAQSDPGKAKPKIIPQAQQWLDNQDWWDDPDKEGIRRLVAQVDRKLLSAGYSPKERAYYRELERIIEERHPGVVVPSEDLIEGLDDDDDIEIRPKAAKEGTQQRRAASPVAAADRTGIASRQGRRGTTLTQSDVNLMKTFGMDPANPAHVENFMQEVVSKRTSR